VAMGSPVSTRRRRGRTPMAEINVTPLVDVMLVLLIIFMVTAPLLNAGVPVELPESQAKALDQAPKQVNVTLTVDGRLYIDNAEIDPGDFAGRLTALPRGADGKPPQVTLRADTALDYGKVVAVMGELNRAGFNSIQLVTGSSVRQP
jgi:biopolymer transport protein TolR